MSQKRLNLLEIITIKPGRDAKLKEILTSKVIPGIRKRLPDFKWRI